MYFNTFEVICAHTRPSAGDDRDRSNEPPIRFAQFFSPGDKESQGFKDQSTSFERWQSFNPVMAESWWAIPAQADSWFFKCNICGFDYSISAPRLGRAALALINSQIYVFEITRWGTYVDGMPLEPDWQRDSLAVLNVLEDSEAGYLAAVELHKASRKHPAPR